MTGAWPPIFSACWFRSTAPGFRNWHLPVHMGLLAHPRPCHRLAVPAAPHGPCTRQLVLFSKWTDLTRNVYIRKIDLDYPIQNPRVIQPKSKDDLSTNFRRPSRATQAFARVLVRGATGRASTLPPTRVRLAPKHVDTRSRLFSTRDDRHRLHFHLVSLLEPVQ